MSKGKINYSKPLAIRLALPAYMMLEELSKEQKIKIIDLIREAVDEYIINKLGA
jgi:predicted DNA-binding protein